jgi:CheY-specific phosphatase CheX
MTSRPLDGQTPQHLGALLHGLRRVLSVLFETELRYGSPAFRSAHLPVQAELVVAMGFTGDVDGWLALSMSRATAVALAGTLTPDRSQAFAAMAGDGLHEVANVLGSACGIALHKRGYRMKVDQPIVAVDEPLHLPWPTPMVLEVPVDLPQGRLLATIALKVRSYRSPARPPGRPPGAG